VGLIQKKAQAFAWAFLISFYGIFIGCPTVNLVEAERPFAEAMFSG
jgi:hypothetical protein